MKLIKNRIKYFFILVFTSLIITMAINFTIDPLQQYRKASFYEPYEFAPRYMAWGMLKNYDYDSVLFGSSMSRNFIKSEIDEKLNLNIMKIAMNGTSPHELNLLLKFALNKNKNIKKIILNIDLFAFSGEVDRLRFGENSIPFYLQNNIYLDDYKYLLNVDVLIKNNLKLLASNKFGLKKDKINYDKFYFNAHRNTYNKNMALKDFNNRIKKKSTKNETDKYKYEKLINSFNYNILSHIKKHPNKKFIIFFPPYSILAYKYFEYKGTLKNMLLLKEEVLNTLIQYQNISIFDFQTTQNITHNLDLYKDVSHYSADVNSWMVDNIKLNSYIIQDINDIKNSINLLESQIHNYKLDN